MKESELEELARAYLDAFEKRDFEACIDLYMPESVIHFGPGTYAGMKNIEEWHRERFDADLRLTGLDETKLEGKTVSARVVAVSEKIKAWGLDSIQATLTLVFEGKKIKEARFDMLDSNPLETWSDK